MKEYANAKDYSRELDGTKNKNSTLKPRYTINGIKQCSVKTTLTEKGEPYTGQNSATDSNKIKYDTSALAVISTIYETTQESAETTTMRTKKNRTVILQDLKYRTSSANIKDHPYMVSIQKEMIHSCCGTIVSSFWVLSAAHCLTLPGSTLRLIDVTKILVVAGQSQLGLGKMQLRRAKDLYVHSQFVKKLLSYDIGMINLFQPFDLNDYVNLVRLSSSVSKPYTFFGDCFVVSWTVWRKDFLSFDKLRAEDETNRKLFRVPEIQIVNLPTISTEECSDRIEAKEFLNQRDHICTEYGTYKNVACATDAGSPLICGGRQYGIFSWGIGCDDYEYPGVFTKVASFRKWIHNIETDPDEYISRNETTTRIHLEYLTYILLVLCIAIMNCLIQYTE